MDGTTAAQARLSDEQIDEFLHDHFVEDQVHDFTRLVGDPATGVVIDIGGGGGFFARALADRTGVRTRVIDVDRRSVEECRARGVDAVQGDALAPRKSGDEGVVCFNLVLHHLVGASERATRQLQVKALAAWCDSGRSVFVNEYIYQSLVGRISGRLIYAITASRVLSAIGRAAARVVPVLRANTFGTGVRFRSHEEWRELFAEAGYRVAEFRIGRREIVALPLRGLLIKEIRRDSFLLEPA